MVRAGADSNADAGLGQANNGGIDIMRPDCAGAEARRKAG